jgi:hypothetical protein
MLFPVIDEDVPLPANATEAMPNLTPAQELEMRARTIKLISDLSGTAVVPDEDDIATAKELARGMMENPQMRPEYGNYPNETLAYLAGLVAQSNYQIVDELSDLKMYVVNKLIYEVEHSKDPKARIAALTKLGEVDGVDAFKKRTEMTIQVKPIAEVEKELLETLSVLETHFIEVQPQEAPQNDD